jgi:hypothetical protein
MSIENTEVQVEDRRAVIEAAFDAEEQKVVQVEVNSADVSAPAKTTTEDSKGGHVEPKEGGPDVSTPAETKAPNDAPGSKSLQSQEPGEKPVNVDRAPQAWKPGPKAKWATLDPEVRQEVMRRERDTTQVLNDSAQARQLQTQFQQVIQPFMGRLTSLNAHPLAAVQELLKADYLLSSSPPAQKAQFLAKLIKDYGVDIAELDNALSGRPAADPVSSQVEILLQERLAPFQQYIEQQQRRTAAQEQQTAQELQHTVETMAQDPKYPYFEDVREAMADIVEIMAKRGQHITIEAAYNRAVAMDPVISQEVSAKAAADAQAAQAAHQNGRAQRALNASSSVGGAPSGTINGTPAANDRRAVIAAAFDAAGGR